MSKPDFGPGDLVVCVDDGPDEDGDLPLFSRRGQVFEVAVMWPPEQTDGYDWGFDAVGDPESGFCRACWRFRKIDRADDEFTAQIRACRPVPGKVPA